MWVDPDGSPSPAPWLSPEFVNDVERGFHAEIMVPTPSFARLWIFADAAARAEGGHGLPSPLDIEHLANVWTIGSTALRLTDPPRARLIADAYEESRLDGSFCWRIKVLLEAMSPSARALLSRHWIESIVDALELTSHDLRDVIVDLLRAGLTVADPVAHIAPMVDATRAEEVGSAESRLITSRRELHDYFRSVVNAGGGKILQTHCRLAWERFTAAVIGELKLLFPPEHGGEQTTWKEGRFASFVDGIEDLHRHIADRGGAKLRDRVRMDRIAKRLAGYARQVDSAMADMRRAQERRAGLIGGAAIRAEAFRRLLSSALADGVEEFLRRTLERAFSRAPSSDDQDPLTIDISDAARAPELLELLPPVSPGTAAVGRVQALADTRSAAVLLLRSASVEPPADMRALAAHLRREGRDHIVERLAAVLDPNEVIQLRARASRRADEMRAAVLAVSRAAAKLSDLASSVAPDVRRTRDEADRLIETGVARWSSFGAWLQACLSAAQERIERAVGALRAEASGRDAEMAASVTRSTLKRSPF